jgi:hypothetical protein
MYFIQGIGDPTSGLIAQPVRSLLKSWGDSPTTISAFMGLLALPWSLKVLFGCCPIWCRCSGRDAGITC